MSSAHRPTWDPAQGKDTRSNSRIYSSRDIAAHTRLKFRQVSVVLCFVPSHHPGPLHAQIIQLVTSLVITSIPLGLLSTCNRLVADSSTSSSSSPARPLDPLASCTVQPGQGTKAEVERRDLKAELLLAERESADRKAKGQAGYVADRALLMLENQQQQEEAARSEAGTVQQKQQQQQEADRRKILAQVGNLDADDDDDDEEGRENGGDSEDEASRDQGKGKGKAVDQEGNGSRLNGDDDDEDDSDSDSDDDEDETAELLRELEKIKKERAEEKERQVSR